MANDIPDIETDPCGRAVALRALLDANITGGGVTEVESEQGNGVRRRVKYSPADLARLEAQIRTAQAACDKKNGKAAKRFAVTPRGGGW